ncbi:MAG: hypothetical protein COB04_07975 [Gammaproteobacteria bacterium]|nr:MAG: hypothetical protein COB04_07975 [Gammaproteobacteria bacterium]
MRSSIKPPKAELSRLLIKQASLSQLFSDVPIYPNFVRGDCPAIRGSFNIISSQKWAIAAVINVAVFK